MQEGPRSTATATVDGPEQSERREDGSRASVPGRNLPRDGRLDTAQSLWDRAYDALGTEDPKLVENYEKVLSRELSKTSVYQLQGINRGR